MAEEWTCPECGCHDMTVVTQSIGEHVRRQEICSKCGRAYIAPPHSADKPEIHKSLCNELHKTYLAKNTAYGDSFSKTWDDYGITSALVRMSDKWQRLNSLAKGAKNDVPDESIIDTLKDLANYALMTAMEIQTRKAADSK